MSEKDLIVVNSDSFGVGDVVSEQCAFQWAGAGFPACKGGYEVKQDWMFTEILRVPLLAMSIKGQGDKISRLVLMSVSRILDERVHATDADARKLRGVFCCVEDACYWFCTVFEHAARSEELEVLLSSFEHIAPGKNAFEVQVSIPLKSISKLSER